MKTGAKNMILAILLVLEMSIIMVLEWVHLGLLKAG